MVNLQTNPSSHSQTRTPKIKNATVVLGRFDRQHDMKSVTPKHAFVLGENDRRGVGEPQ